MNPIPDHALTPKGKLRSLEAQLELMERGQIQSIECPYCGNHNMMGENICCDKLIAAMNAVIDRKEQEEREQLAERIAENVGKTAPLKDALIRLN